MISRILIHLNFIISLMILTFLILDEFNPTMGFIDNDITNLILWGFCITVSLNSILLIIKNTKKDKKMEEL